MRPEPSHLNVLAGTIEEGRLETEPPSLLPAADTG